MLLSIWVLTYNRLSYLELLLNSIFESQVLKNSNVELIIIDNASTDGTRDFISTLKRQENIRTLSRNSNLRGSGVVEDFLSISSGKWIFSVGDDDICYPGTLKQLPKLLEELSDKEVALVPFAASTIDENGLSTPIDYSPSSETEQIHLLAKLLDRSIYWLPATIFRRSLLSSGIPTTITVFDWWLWLSGVVSGKVYPITKLQIVKYRIHSGQDQRSFAQDSWDLERALCFMEFIDHTIILEWIKNANKSQVLQLLESVLIETKGEPDNFVSKLINIKLALRIATLHSDLTEELIGFLINQRVDPRFVTQFFKRETKSEHFRQALESIDMRLPKEIAKIASENADFENKYVELFQGRRIAEIENQITPFESRLIKLYRKLRFNNFMRKLLRK
jgi:glycosyltransferase involved in cell wall biosynthesis